jgi:hypothetical protein
MGAAQAPHYSSALLSGPATHMPSNSKTLETCPPCVCPCTAQAHGGGSSARPSSAVAEQYYDNSYESDLYGESDSDGYDS